MKKIFLLACAGFLQLQVAVAQTTTAIASAKMKQLSPYFLFTEKAAPKGTVTASQPKGSFGTGDTKLGFSIRMKVNLQPFSGEQVLAEIPGLLTIKLRQADPNIRDRQNYPAALMQDGSLPVLEAGLMLASPVIGLFKRQLDIGYPLALLKNPWGQHEVILNFTGSHFAVYVDNELMDNEFAIGYPQWWHQNSWEINPAVVSEAKIFFPALKAERDHSKKDAKDPNVQYWMPRGHNSWVGDVATLFHEGRYHVFYLYDRRHHSSKFGVGGHYFEHFSTTDFISWTEHEAATPIEEQWETFGTGTPFVYNNKLHISYGLHTSRIYPDSLTMYPRIMDYYKQHQKTGYFLGDVRKVIPSGATYSVSADNVSNFKKSAALFHYSENPSVFTSPEGKLKMFANYRSKGTWESSTLDSGWHCTDPEFPLGGDCTFSFAWGKYEYVVGGFVNLWKRPLGATTQPWTDEVAAGKDLYNGVNVPSVSDIGNGRYIMAGWMPIKGWGGPVLIHELIQYPDGRLGTKWMKELVPPTGAAVELAKKTEQATAVPVKDESFILSFEVHPKKKRSGKLALSFLSQGDKPFEKACELQINTEKSVAQYADAVKDSYAATERSIRQGAAPQLVGNYAIENVMGTDKPFTVRVLVKRNAKLGGTIIDTEIAGQNTMVTYREGLTIDNIAFNLTETGIRNIKVMKIED